MARKKKTDRKPRAPRGTHVDGMEIPISGGTTLKGPFFEPMHTRHAAVLFTSDGKVCVWKGSMNAYVVYRSLHKARRGLTEALSGYQPGSNERVVLSHVADQSRTLQQYLLLWRELPQGKREQVIIIIDEMTEKLTPLRSTDAQFVKETVEGMVGILDDTGRLNPIATVAKLVHRVDPAILARAFAIHHTIVPRLLAHLLVVENEIVIERRIVDDIRTTLQSCPLFSTKEERQRLFWDRQAQRENYGTRLDQLAHDAQRLYAHPYYPLAQQMAEVAEHYKKLATGMVVKCAPVRSMLFAMRGHLYTLAVYERLRDAYELLCLRGDEHVQFTAALEAYRSIDDVVSQVRAFAREGLPTMPRQTVWGQHLIQTVYPLLTATDNGEKHREPVSRRHRAAQHSTCAVKPELRKVLDSMLAALQVSPVTNL